MASALEKKIREQEDRARSAMRKARESRQAMERTLVRKATVAGTAAVMGTLSRYGVANDIGGFPWKVILETVALIGEGTTTGNVQAAMGGIADSTLAIYIERSISTDSLIAGRNVPGTGEHRVAGRQYIDGAGDVVDTTQPTDL